MLNKKINVVIFLVIIAVIALAVTSIITLNLVENARMENEGAKFKIDLLNHSISSLESELEKARKETSENKDRIEKYQEIITAWAKATPSVNEAVEKIVNAAEDVLSNFHLYPSDRVNGFEDEMMDAVYGAIRSTDPISIAADFVANVESINEARYDNIIRKKIDEINKNGVSFPEDASAIEELRDYYDSFVNEASVVNSFKEKGLENELLLLEALLDTDEENDLAKAFENAVAEILTPITPNTSFDKANGAWNALCDAFEPNDAISESTVRARLLLDVYIIQANRLADLTKSIRKEIDRIHTADPDVSHEEIAELDDTVDELLSLDVTLDILNTDSTDYVALLFKARLLPHKNDAFAKVKAAYDDYYTKANGDRELLILLVEIKDYTFNAIEGATSVDEIDTLVENTIRSFENCFN